MLTSRLINLRRLEVFTHKGYDSKSNRQAAYMHGFLPRIMKRKCRSSRRQNEKRVRVEHTFGWIDNFRRLRVQYEYTPHVHLAYTVVALGHLLCNCFLAHVPILWINFFFTIWKYYEEKNGTNIFQPWAYIVKKEHMHSRAAQQSKTRIISMESKMRSFGTLLYRLFWISKQLFR